MKILRLSMCIAFCVALNLTSRCMLISSSSSAIAQGHASLVRFVYNVRSYGAKGDGKALDSPAINRAIEAAAAKGGGTVYLSGRNV